MYGQDSDKRYPGLQNEFFMRAGDVLRRREALRGFVALGKQIIHNSSRDYHLKIAMAAGGSAVQTQECPASRFRVPSHRCSVFVVGCHRVIASRSHNQGLCTRACSLTCAALLPGVLSDCFCAVSVQSLTWITDASAGGIGAIVAFGLKGSKDSKLPIVKGPQTSGEHVVYCSSAHFVAAGSRQHVRALVP